MSLVQNLVPVGKQATAMIHIRCGTTFCGLIRMRQGFVQLLQVGSLPTSAEATTTAARGTAAAEATATRSTTATTTTPAATAETAAAAEATATTTAATAASSRAATCSTTLLRTLDCAFGLGKETLNRKKAVVTNVDHIL